MRLVSGTRALAKATLRTEMYSAKGNPILLHSTEYLRILDKHDGRLLLERAFPDGHLKADALAVITCEGRPLIAQTPQGFRGRIQLPRAILDDFLAVRYVEPDGEGDGESRAIYRLTDDGRRAARAA